MKKYGLKIGDVGVEFPSREERQKALMIFTGGSTVKIQAAAIRYVNHDGAFSTYERDDKEVLVTCNECNGVFSHDACPKRTYMRKPSWSDKFSEGTDYVCDGCMEAQRKAKEIFDAKAVIAKSGAAE